MEVAMRSLTRCLLHTPEKIVSSSSDPNSEKRSFDLHSKTLMDNSTSEEKLIGCSICWRRRLEEKLMKSPDRPTSNVQRSKALLHGSSSSEVAGGESDLL
ncbi:hypothetical protein LWI28_013974 [Acer negundo]|uniref:Uncharacterized protein n=1 Tax=Acer negundo TaxID=4023 RepID=A0AAD5I9H8_ACENE|nr:hypothetical protein LWI28_013974 [Acer negundo]